MNNLRYTRTNPADWRWSQAGINTQPNISINRSTSTSGGGSPEGTSGDCAGYEADFHRCIAEGRESVDKISELQYAYAELEAAYADLAGAQPQSVRCGKLSRQTL